MKMDTSGELHGSRTSKEVAQDLEVWRHEADIVLAEIGLASAKMRLHGPGTTGFAEAQTAQHDAFRRYGELD